MIFDLPRERSNIKVSHQPDDDPLGQEGARGASVEAVGHT